MQLNFGSKAASAITMGLLFGGYMHHDYVNWSVRGRDAFLAHQMARFDQYMASPRPAGLTIFSATLVIVGSLTLYEFMAFIFSKILKES